MSKGVLWTIKIAVIFVALVIIVIAKEAGVPIIVANLIGLGIIFAVWKYKPEETKENNDNNQLDKS
ncbi:hypothetical protein [Cloacibacterium caeni]|jgi:flagellar biosynthesis component FlhA|uniref:hypothetical protein n=1 Tax=Cloacibacterium caeni TaxID=2004710 RepID=UPI001BCD6DC6|nr:hypothetical protein [Cloacibacterium caeni]